MASTHDDLPPQIGVYESYTPWPGSGRHPKGNSRVNFPADVARLADGLSAAQAKKVQTSEEAGRSSSIPADRSFHGEA